MGSVLYEQLENYAGGVNSAAPEDLLPDNASPQAFNSILANTAPGVSVIAKRPGFRATNTNAATTDAIIGQVGFRRRISALATEQFHLAFDAGGRLLRMLPGGTLSVLSTPFTAGYYLPNAATMNNLLHIVNGQDRIVFDGTNAYPSGLPAPAAPGAVAGAAGVMTGVYDIAVTYFDLASGLESSRSASTSVTVAAQQINVTWVVPPTTHPYTHTNVYIRKQTLQTQFFRIAQIAAPGVATTINATDAQLNALIIQAPDTAENNQIPANVIDVAAHVSRLFACDLRQVYYSNLNQPEAFDPNNFFTTNTDDGKPLTAIHSAHEVLIIFKRDSMWALYGEDPSTWIVRLVSPDVGCLSKKSIITVEGMTYWWSEQGPMAWNGDGAPLPIGRDALRPDIAPTILSYPALDPTPAQNFIGPVSAFDPVGQRVVYGVPTINSTRNNRGFSFHYGIGSWETNGWDLIDAASLASIEDDNSIPRIYLGSYHGQIFDLSESTLTDGVPSGTERGTITSSSLSQLTDSGASFLTTGYSLVGRYVSVYDSDGNVAQRVLITSNTATQLNATFTVAPPIGATYGIGGIAFSYDTSWRTFGNPFLKKRYEYGYFLIGSNTADTVVRVDLFTNYNSLSFARTYQVIAVVGGLVWDQGQWDVDLWDFGSLNRARKRLAKTGFVYRFRIRHALPGADVVLYKTACRAEALTDKT